MMRAIPIIGMVAALGLAIGCCNYNALQLHRTLVTPGTASSSESGYWQVRGREPIVFEHVAVVPMDREIILENQDVLINDEKIATISAAGTFAIPAGALRIDAKGLYLMPGLADMHVHLYDTEGFPSYLAYGFTTVANLNGSPSDLKWRAEINSGTLLGPTIYTAGPAINGYPPGNSTFVSVETPDQARRVVDAQKEAGYDFIKVYSSLSTDCYDAIMREARSRDIAVLGHIPFDVDTADAINGYQSNIAHMEEVYNSYFKSGPDESRLPKLTSMVAKSGISVTPNLVAYSDYLRSVEDLNKVLHDPEMEYASPALYSQKLPAHNRSVRANPRQFAAYLKTGHAFFMKMTKSFSDAGVPLMLGTDTEGFGYPGAAGALELKELTGSGLTPYQALVTATRVPGEYMYQRAHAPDRFGLVRAGYRADLLLVEGNPLVKLPDAGRIRGVMVRGRWLSSEVIRKMRQAKAAENGPLRATAAEIDADLRGGKVKEGEDLFNKFGKLAPGKRLLAEIVLEQDGNLLLDAQPAQALTIYKMSIELYPESFSTYTNVAVAYDRLGEYERAIEYARKALALSPDDSRAAILLDKVRTGREPLTVDFAGDYGFRTSFNLGGAFKQITGAIHISNEGDKLSGTLSLSGEPARELERITAGRNKIWFNAKSPYGGLEFRLAILGAQIQGRVNTGFGNDRILIGTKEK
jgi:tetratricopeptide (TPR) repeat protein